jgi:ribosome production factor 1
MGRKSNKNEIPGGRRIGRAVRVEGSKRRRSQKQKEKKERQRERQEKRQALGETAMPKEKPKTLESMRERDVTMVAPDDEEVLEDEANDEFVGYFTRQAAPKVLITISPGSKLATWKFCHELKKCIPNAGMFSRKGVAMKRLIKQAIKGEYSDILVVNEDRGTPNAITLCHLPNGPTAHFKLTSVRMTSAIKKHGDTTDHFPEVILNNFNTRLGHTIARMLACIFPFDPEFRGRRVVTFHNQRDFIFFRHHRYEFKREGKKAALLELGPRFTLKLRSLQHGTFDTKFGEYVWIHKRHEMETSRRRFFL